jgi:hypothetical protein
VRRFTRVTSSAFSTAAAINSVRNVQSDLRRYLPGEVRVSRRVANAVRDMPANVAIAAGPNGLAGIRGCLPARRQCAGSPGWQSDALWWGYNQVAQQANEQYVPALDSSAGCQRGADSSEHNNATAWVNAESAPASGKISGCANSHQQFCGVPRCTLRDRLAVRWACGVHRRSPWSGTSMGNSAG